MKDLGLGEFQLYYRVTNFGKITDRDKIFHNCVFFLNEPWPEFPLIKRGPLFSSGNSGVKEIT